MGRTCVRWGSRLSPRVYPLGFGRGGRGRPGRSWLPVAKGSVVADLGVGSRVVAVCRKSRLLRAAEKGLHLEISGSLPGRQPGRDAARLTRTAQDEAGIPEIEGH